MVGAALARGAWCCILLIVHHCCCDFCGTILASYPKAEEETNKDLVQEDSHRSFGAENTQKDPQGFWVPQVPSYLEPFGSSQLSASSGRDVVALQRMQHSQFEPSRNLPKMFSALVQVLDAEAEEVEIKEYQEQGQENDLTTIEARREQKCPGCVSGTGPMDSEHASKSVACSQEGRELFAGGRGFGIAPTTNTSTTSQATSSTATGKCFDDSGGDQALGESPRIASLRYDFARRDVGQATRIGAEGERSCNLQKSDSRSYQQAPQDQRQARCATPKDQGHGSRMGQVRGHHYGEDHAPRQPLQAGSCGIGAAVSREDVGAAELESRDQFSLEVHAASCTGGTDPCPDGFARGTTIRKAARSTSRRSERSSSCGRDAGGSDRSAASGLKRFGQGVSSGQASPGEAQDFSSCSLSQSSRTQSPQGQKGDQGSQGSQGWQERLEAVDSRFEHVGFCSNSRLNQRFVPDFPWVSLCNGRIEVKQERIGASHGDVDFVVPLHVGTVSLPEAVVQTTTGRKAVGFVDAVDVIAFSENRSVSAVCSLSQGLDWLRCLWTLDCQCARWKGFEDVFRARNGCALEVADALGDEGQCGSQQVSSIDVPGRLDIPSSSLTTADRHAVALTHADWPRVQALLSGHLLPRWCIETWYVDPTRFPIAAQSRDVPLNSQWTLDGFEQACRDTWQELMLPDRFQWWIVQDPLMTSPHVKLRVIIAHNIAPSQTVSLLHYAGLPVFNKFRAVCFEDGTIAGNLIAMISTRLELACSRATVRCVLEYGPPWDFRTTGVQEQVWIHSPTVIHAQIMELDGDSSSEDDAVLQEEQDSDHDDVSTHLHTSAGSDTATDSDESSWMMTSLDASSLQPLPPAEGWMPEMADIDPGEVEVEDVDNEAMLLEHQWQALVDIHQSIVGGEEQPNIRVVTYGLGLISLGRREATVRSQDVHVVLAAVADLWSDHAQIAPLQIILVQPQPAQASVQGQIVFIVEVQHLENQDRHRPCPVLIQESGDPSMVLEESTYAAWVGFRGNRATFLSSIQRDDGIFPNGVRDSVMLWSFVLDQRCPEIALLSFGREISAP